MCKSKRSDEFIGITKFILNQFNVPHINKIAQQFNSMIARSVQEIDIFPRGHCHCRHRIPIIGVEILTACGMHAYVTLTSACLYIAGSWILCSLIRFSRAFKQSLENIEKMYTLAITITTMIKLTEPT